MVSFARTWATWKTNLLSTMKPISSSLRDICKSSIDLSREYSLGKRPVLAVLSDPGVVGCDVT